MTLTLNSPISYFSLLQKVSLNETSWGGETLKTTCHSSYLSACLVLTILDSEAVHVDMNLTTVYHEAVKDG